MLKLNSRFLVKLVLINTVCFFECHAQEKKKPFLLNEFHISINATNVNDNNTENRIGFGFGAYHTWKKDEKLNFSAGFEFNSTNQFKKNFLEGTLIHYSNLNYRLNFLSFPLTIRYNFGDKTKLFIEGGPFVDYLLSARRKGDFESISPIPGNEGTGTINDTPALSSNYGLSFGMGLVLPFKKFGLLIQPDYKLGLKELYKENSFSIVNSYFRLSLGLIRK
jgi:hypothetical protein